MGLCIYCKKESANNAPPEHIIPESLGCPPEFVLRNGEVCRICNNGPLARLDSELNDTFGLPKVASIMRNKKGKPSSVQVNNLYAENNDGHVHIHLNFEKHPIHLDNGKVLSPMQKNSFATKQKLEVINNVAALNFQIPMIRSKQTIRALHKLAFGALCYFLGRDYALQSTFDEVRAFVIYGLGERELLVQRQNSLGFGPQGHRFDSPKVGTDGEHIVPFNFFGIEMMIQLAGNMVTLHEIAQKSEGMFVVINGDGRVA